MSESIGFLILHYNTIKETIDCAESIRHNIDTEKYHIVIVDNASPNGTGRKLAEKYKNSDRITVIRNKENLGFANGNNIGYRYCKEVLNCSFVCVLNNDTLVIQKDFFAVVKKEYARSSFSIMGPQIILKNGKINLLYYRFPDAEHFRNELKMHKKDYLAMKWHLNYPYVAFKLLRNQVRRIFGKEKKSPYRQYQLFEHLDQRREDVVLHGCCIIFSPQYAQHYEEAFDPRTFLYKEEELLYLRCRKRNLKIVYNPELMIKHLEDVATNSINRKRRNKIRFWLENQIRSLEILINELEEGV